MQVPVFRYALERWATDKYEAIVLYHDQLDEKAAGMVESLRAGSKPDANITVQAVDIKQCDDADLQALWKSHASTKSPLLVLRYPIHAREVPHRVFYAAPLGRDSLDQLCFSPLRREITKRLVEGQSAVWVFVPCGKPELDTPAMQTLKEQLVACQKTLVLPLSMTSN